MKFNDIFTISAFLALLIISNLSVAEQLSFQKLKRGDDYLFQYRWKDINHKNQSMEFLLPKKDLFTRFRSFKSYKESMATEFVKLSLKKYFRDHPIKNVQITFSEQTDGLQIQITGENNSDVDKAYQKAEILEQEFMQQYLHENYYHLFTMNNGKRGIKPDHVRIANESVDDLKSVKPVILEEVTVKNIRKVTNFILGFVQNIPYETLQSRATSSGSGFNTPLRLLWENKGDCDSKVTLTAALLRALMPRIKIALVFIDNHAIFGINIPPEDNETTILYEGTTYVLADPTGPRLMNIGQLSDHIQNIVLSGLYSVEVFEE